MKKLLFVLFTVLISTTTFSQSFNGIEIGGKLSDFVSRMKQKGYSYVEQTENGAVMKGTLSGEIVEFWISVTAKTKVIWKLSIYFPENNSWYSINSDYQKMKNTLTEKYGTPDKTFEFFRNPYTEGDGYEMTAVKVEKAFYSSYWVKKDSNYAISLTITKFAQLRISYENVKNSELEESERKQINKTTF